jgi:hypothetical protein
VDVTEDGDDEADDRRDEQDGPDGEVHAPPS